MNKVAKLLVPLILCLFAISGCSNDKIPFGGKVSFEDGEVVTRGRVSFTTESYMAEGMIAGDGTYQLSSIKNNDGLPPGKYKVVVTGVQKTVGNDMASEKFVSMIDKSYESVETTPLECEITKNGERHYDISLIRSKNSK